MATTDPRTASSVDPTTIGLFVALLGLPTLAFASEALSVLDEPLVSIGLQWTLLAVVLLVTLRWEGRSLHSIGVRRPIPVDVAYLLVAAVCGFLALAATGPLVDALGLAHTEGPGIEVDETGIPIALLGAVTVGVVEELLYRGYAIERLEEYAGGAVVAGAVSWVAFTLAHAASWLPGDLLQISLAALVFTLVYLRRRSVVPVVGAHVIIWLLGVLGAIYG